MLFNLSAAMAYGWKLLLTLVPWPCLLALLALLFAVRVLLRRSRLDRRQAAWERSRRLELESYSRLEVTLPVDAEPRKLVEQGKRICRLIAEKSCYPRSALYLRSTSGDMVCAGSSGMDDLTLEALAGWGKRIVLEETVSGRDNERRSKDAVTSFTVKLGTNDDFDGLPGRGCRTATIVPLRMTRGRLVGALVVCETGEARLNPEQELQAIIPIEVLAARLAGSVERMLIVQRLIEMERLACAGQIVAGIAHEMEDPLATVLAVAEAASASLTEPRAQQGFATIVAEALKMREILAGLRGFWRPRETADAIAETKDGPA